MTGNGGDKPRSPFWILLWTGFALSVVSAVVDHDADYVLGTGLSAVFSAMDIALSLWMAVALVKRCRWAKFAYVVVAVLNGLLFAFGCCELMSDNFLIDLIDAASLLVIPAACSVLLLFSKPLRGEFTGRVMPRLTFYLTVWLSVATGFLGLCTFNYCDGRYLPRCMEAAKDGSRLAARDLMEMLFEVQAARMEGKRIYCDGRMVRAYEDAGVAVYEYVNGGRSLAAPDSEERKLNDEIWTNLIKCYRGEADVDAVGEALERFVQRILADKGRFDRIIQTLAAEDKRFADKLEKLRNPPLPHFRWNKTRGNNYPSWSPRNW